jgi:CheY-like chemotaxis protein
VPEKPVVLVIDDDALVALSVESALIDGGFDVEMADSAQAAVQALEQDYTKFCAIVTDVNMGRNRETGWEVARRGRELNPTLPVVYISGESAHQWLANGVPNSMIVEKPFAPAQIVIAISQLLNAS